MMLRTFLDALEGVLPREVKREDISIPIHISRDTKEHMLYALNNHKKENIQLPCITIDLVEIFRERATFRINIFSQYFNDFVIICEDIFAHENWEVEKDGRKMDIRVESITKGKNITNHTSGIKIVQGEGCFSVSLNNLE